MKVVSIEDAKNYNKMELIKMQAMSYYMLYLVTDLKHYLISACDLGCWYRCLSAQKNSSTKTYKLKVAI